jgi:enoyl-CoA hydratase/carnithine racemase
MAAARNASRPLPAAPATTSTLAVDRKRYGAFWAKAAALLARLPAKPGRSAEQGAQAREILAAARESRTRFMRAHAREVYDALTRGRREFVRIEELCGRAARAFPGLVPDARTLARDSGIPQRDKDGVEVDHGIFVSQVLADRDAGLHLCHAMLLPRAESLARRAEYERKGELALPGAHLARRGKASVVTMRNPEYLNAEDENTLPGFETAVDLALLDPKTEVCVLRGDAVTHAKHAGRSVFGAGINLTHLYEGRIRLLWYLIRDLGVVNKLYRGLARPDAPPEEESIEKLWIAAVEGFAIGGHCQLLLTIDRVIAAEDAYMTLPARKEGIIPGAANLRLARRVGDRVARQAILAERRIDFASAEGRLVCDEIAGPGEIGERVEQAVAMLTGSGVVSAAGNRRALRIGEEPLDAFRRYMAVYAREQAHCHFSPALVSNLEQYWVGSRAGRPPVKPV